MVITNCGLVTNCDNLMRQRRHTVITCMVSARGGAWKAERSPTHSSSLSAMISCVDIYMYILCYTHMYYNYCVTCSLSYVFARAPPWLKTLCRPATSRGQSADRRLRVSTPDPRTHPHPKPSPEAKCVRRSASTSARLQREPLV